MNKIKKLILKNFFPNIEKKLNLLEESVVKLDSKANKYYMRNYRAIKYLNRTKYISKHKVKDILDGNANE